MHSLDDRYPPNWNDLSKLTLAVTLGQCCNCFIRAAKKAHHSSYPAYHLQLPFLCTFGLCNRCHGIAHRSRNWLTFETKTKHDDRNTHAFTLQLRVRMLILWGIELSMIVFIVQSLIEMIFS